MQATTRAAVIIVVGAVFISTGAAAAFNFGITPSKVDKGVQEPGEKFFVSFNVVSGQTEQLDVSLDTATADVTAFQQLNDRETAENYSEQRCDGCIEFLKAGGQLREYTRDGSINQWKPVEFFVTVPDDVEPGYHMLAVTPQPTTASGSGSVGVVSSATFPVIFRVPGKAVRSTRLLGLQTGKTTDDRQHIVATLYNDGTVTVTTRTAIRVPADDGPATLQAGTRRLAPGETAQVTGRIPTDQLTVQNGTFTANATVDYGTGMDRFTTRLQPREPVKQPSATGAVAEPGTEDQWSLPPYLLLAVILAMTTLTTWKVVQRARY
jgi:hypothetical protein